jgi:tetratricopeptide (TPR) repeat protein
VRRRSAISAGAVLAALLPLLGAAACAAPGGQEDRLVEAVSLLGEPLVRPAIAPDRLRALEADLAEARAAYEADPDDAEAIIWLGRRLAYPGRYAEAVEVFSEGIRKHPEDARMYRHRGHRHITLRQLDAAVRDLDHAARLTRDQPDEIEPDGAPNPYGIPRSTLQSNIWYHLALAHYLRGDFEAAVPAWQEALEVSTNDDMWVATADWLYMTLRRLGRDAEAAAALEPVHREMEILENHAYHRRLLMYRGEIEPEALLDFGGGDPVQVATQGYGVANWYLYNGDEPRAQEIFRRILQTPNWAAFGYIAAEAELSREGAGREP